MNTQKTRIWPVAGLLWLLGLATSGADAWPFWRGDLEGSGRTAAKDLPISWGKDQSIRWKVDLPERGNSTPVIAGGRVFVTQAVEKEGFRGLYCFDRKDGSLLWKKGVTYQTPERTHRSNPYCSASPATDGEIVVASYGSAGLAAYDWHGNQIWRREFGAMDHTWGNGSSPLLYGNLCVHYHGPGPGSFLIAVDKTTGETVWKYEEPEWKAENRTDGFRDRPDQGVIGSWSTPILVPVGDREELVMSFPEEIKGLDPRTGKELWSCGGLNPLLYTSPVYHEGMVVALGGYYGNSIGVKLGGKGDVTETHRLWRRERHNGGIGTGVAHGGHLYYQTSGGVANCIDFATGETVWEERLPGAGKSWGSFVLAGDHIYTLSQAGDTVIFKADPEGLTVIGQGDVGEETNASLSVSEGEIFLRTWEALWCISDSDRKS